MQDYSGPYKRQTMWEISPDNLLAAMQRAGINQSQLAQAVGVKQPSIGRLLSGETKTTRALERIAEALGTTVAYLKGVEDEPAELGEVKAAKPLDRSEDDTVEIVEFDLAYGMGAAYIHDEHRSSKMRKFSLGFVRHFSRSPINQLMFAHGIGDSMMPVIHDSDYLLIDTSQQAPRMADQIWAVQLGGMGMIKRLRPTKDGMGIQLISENKDLPIEIAYDGEMQIVGRVVAIIKKV